MEVYVKKKIRGRIKDIRQFFFYVFFFFFFLGLHPQLMEVPRLEVESEL